MGQDTREKTKFIFSSLLTLGLFETNNNTLDKKKILDDLEFLDIDYRHYVDRYLNHLDNWLKEQQNENSYINHSIGERSRKIYNIDFGRIKLHNYKDFVDVLLLLGSFWNKELDNDKSIEKIIKKDGGKPLGIITKLILDINENNETDKGVKIKYKNYPGTFIFSCQNIFKEGNTWFVNGNIKNNSIELNPPLEIHCIEEIL